MKKGWERKRIGEIAQHSLGKMLDKSKNKGELKPYLRNLNVRWGEFDLSDVLKMRFLPEETSRYTAVKGDVLVCEGGYPGRAAIWDDNEPIYFQKALHRIRFHEPERNKWFVYFLRLRDLEGTLKNHFNGTGIQHFTGEALAQFEIPVPPLPEQQRIVGVLDEAFAGLDTAQAHAEKNLENARAIFDSHLQSVLTNKIWQWKRLGDLCEGVEYGSSAKSLKEGNVPVLRMGNIQAGKLIWENLAYSNDRDEVKKYLLKHNDVLFNRTNSPELVGKSAIYKSEMPAIFAGYLIRIHRKEDLLDADFLNYFLNSRIALDYGKTVMISSVNQANINGAKLKDYPIPAPTLAEQRRIVAELDSLATETQRLEGLYQHKRGALAALKKSLLHQAFTGAL